VLIKEVSELEVIVQRRALFLVTLLTRVKFSGITLVDLLIVDRPQQNNRFYAKYVFLNTNSGVRLCISTVCDAKSGLISLVGLFGGIQ
jgi:NADH:ubiquinone oxidoreductase subunit C